MRVTLLYGDVAGVLPANIIQSSMRLLIGIWGVAASWRGRGAPRAFARAAAVLFGLLTIMGLIPATSSAFGLMPLYGNNIWLHGALALLGALAGWGIPTSRPGDGDIPY